MKRLYRYLPESILNIILRLPDELQTQVCELRLRRDAPLSLSTYTKNLFVTSSSQVSASINKAYICSEAEMIYAVSALTEGSVYRYTESVNSGYIVTRQGIRAGVIGEAVYNGSKISSVSQYTALNIRIPHDIENSGDEILRYIKDNQNTSILIYSPPGYGKTTVLRSVASGLALGRAESPKRVCVIDERGEIMPNGAVGLLDRFVGYKKPIGIEIAVRAFSPEYVVCDEIGLTDDIEAILSVQNTGVPFLATTHGASLDEILKRPNIKRLIDSEIFGAFVRLERNDGKCQAVLEGIK